MTFELTGTASDELPAVLATGATDVRVIFVSMSAREPDGRDADYLEWHSLDHRPEQYRVAGIRHSIRLVSTRACRAARAFGDPRYDAVDHVMTYFFADGAALRPVHRAQQGTDGRSSSVSAAERRCRLLRACGQSRRAQGDHRCRRDPLAAGARRLSHRRARRSVACGTRRCRRRRWNLVARR